MAQRLRGFTRSAPYQMGSALAQPIIIDQAMDWISEPTLRGSRRLAELRIANGMVTAEEQAAVDRAAATARAAREAAERHRIMNNIPNNDVAPSYTDIQRGIETRVTPGWGTASMSAPPPVPFWTRVRRSIFGY
jgi:hypothetical protein